MENEKFANLLRGVPQPLSKDEVLQFAVYCSSQNLSLENWISTSLTLYQINFDICYEFLLFVQKNQIHRPSYNDFIHQPAKIQIFINLAVLTLARAVRESNKQLATKIMEDVKKYQKSAENVNMTADRNIMFFRGFLFYYDGDMNKAINAFKSSYEEMSQNNRVSEQQRLPTISLLTLAQINFAQKNYAQSLNYYKKALLQNRGLPVNARLGMGYCFYELERYELAEMCFQRILKLQENNVQALLGIAVIRNKDNDMKGYFENLMKAYGLNKKHPLVVLHLAEHFLLIGQQDKALKFSELGLKEIQKMPKFIKIEHSYRNDYDEFKARFHNIIGQVYHMRNQYENCIKHYLEAKGKNLPHNQIGLAQAFISTNLFKDAYVIMQKIYKQSDLKTIKQIGLMHRTMAFLMLKVPSKHTIQKGPQYYFKQAIKYNKNDYEACIDFASILGQAQKQNALKFYIEAKTILERLKRSVKLDLLNNLAVSHLQNGQVEKAIEILQKCKQKLQNHGKSNHEEQIKHQGLCLSIYFNLALSYERNFQFSKAILLHQKILQINKFYVDSLVQLSFLYYSSGNKKKAYQILQDSYTLCSPLKMKPYIRIDKIITLKAHYQHMDGSNGQSKQTLKQLNKMKHLYNELYELSLNYETMMRKQVQLVVMKDFLRPNRGFCLNKCREDISNFYVYMICVILLLTDQKISNEQGLFYFNCLKLAEIQFPIILYNFGIFRMKCEDYTGAIFSFTKYNEKTKSNMAGELISLCHLLSESHHESLKTVKVNMLKDPSNLKYRFQYAYVIEKKVQKLFEEQGRKDMEELKQSSINLNMCKNTYIGLSKLGIGDHIRNIDNPDMKDRVKTQLSKIRAESEDRKRFVESQLDYYQKKEKEIMEKEYKIREQQKINLEKIRKAQIEEELFAKILSDSDDEEVKRRKEKEERRRQMLQKLNEKAREVRDKRMQAEENEELYPKKVKKQRKQKRDRPKKEDKKKKEEEIQEEYPSQEQDDYLSEQDEEQDISRNRKHKRKEEKRKKKKKKKDRYEKQERSNPSDYDEENYFNKENEDIDDDNLEEGEKPKKKVKKDDNLEEFDVQNFML